MGSVLARYFCMVGLALALGACQEHREHSGIGAEQDAGDAARQLDANETVRSAEQVEVAVEGPLSMFDRLHVEHLVDDPQRSIAHAMMGTHVYRSLGDTSWETSFVLRIDGGETLIVKPWLCPRTPAAVRSAASGRLAVEQRTVNVDEQGRFWTNGRFGAAFPSKCQYASSADTGGGISALQDGPSLCSEPARSSTKVKVLDAQGNVLATPQVCVARYGALSNSGFSAQVSLVLERAADEAEAQERAFSLSLNHCLRADQQAPLVIAADDIKSAGCAQEAGFLSVGVLGPAGKPKGYDVTAGTWSVSAAGPTPDGGHQSDVDLTFEAQDGTRYRVLGTVSLPQILF